MDSFAAPSLVPADLLLIQSLLGVIDVHKPPTATMTAAQNVDDDDDIDSSGSEYGSEDEIVDVLMGNEDEAALKTASNLTPTESIEKPVAPEDSASDSDISEDSSSEDELPVKTEQIDNDLDDDGERGPTAPSQSYYTSQHEIVDSDIAIPDIEEVGASEILQQVGEISSVLEKVVIIKGLPSSSLESSQKALDSDTLLVFEDRKVLGYIYETFGPTAQPYYQVKFNTSYPIDADKVKPCRPVFHVPARSHFIALRDLHRMRGSDASNVYDEEPADHELDFSDDEAEAEFKRNLKQSRRGNREGSVASSSSRFGTPLNERPLTDAFGTNSVYDAPYGMDDLPSRPPPIPYDDDPYSDNFGAEPSATSFQSAPVPVRPRTLSSQHADRARRPQYRDLRGRGSGRDGRGRGQITVRGHAESNHGHHTPDDLASSHEQISQGYENFQFNPNYANWQFQQQHMVQPHINPRFFGNVGYANPFNGAPNPYWNPSWGPGNGYDGSEPS
ncbi:NAF1-domain-containing protein [Hymenopellis radicata]|nr:NAF1-domain-containing protein [Hymenopellis radicata]